ncbi:MAG TPA: hypothetical protein PKD61_02610 [Polyangiaceae bacterium]|nr:hypothetical protein [Polyangiaceae bacterium]
MTYTPQETVEVRAVLQRCGVLGLPGVQQALHGWEGQVLRLYRPTPQAASSRLANAQANLNSAVESDPWHLAIGGTVLVMSADIARAVRDELTAKGVEFRTSP